MRHSLYLLALTAACQTGPYNGTTVDGTGIGKSFLFQGYDDHANERVSLQVLKTPTLDPDDANNWVEFSHAYSATDATYINSTDPLYYWSVNAIPAPAAASARWPVGGLVRLRAVRTDANGDRILTTFDEATFTDCLSEQLAANADWTTIGMKCAGIRSGIATLVSGANPPGIVGGFLMKKGTITQQQTQDYYDSWDAPANLGAFKTKYGFPGSEATATYYNDGDLGLGREMHCKAFNPGSGNKSGVACYVTNYSGTAGQAVFGADPTTVLADAVSRQHSFATVAMVYDPTASVPVTFVVYAPNGTQQKTAKLDSTGQNQSIPNNCLACHGINSYYTINGNGQGSMIGQARFLPFDPFSYKFSTQAGWTFSDQANAFRRLNALVEGTNVTTATKELIDGMYAPKAVTDSTAVANNDFVPDAWRYANGSLDGTGLYQGFIKVGCRTCHVSASNAGLDWNSPDDVTPYISTIRNEVCNPAQRVMPHAEHVMKRFWKSGARAYLTEGYPTVAGNYPDAIQACKP